MLPNKYKATAIFLVYLISLTNLYVALENWKDFTDTLEDYNNEHNKKESNNNLKFDDEEVCEDCDNNKAERNKYLLNYGLSKLYRHSQNALQQREIEKKSGQMQFYTVDPTCSCKMDHSLMDLGPKYFPRYLVTGACKEGKCEPGSKCTGKTFNVQVLKRKTSLIFGDNGYQNVDPIRENIKDHWTTDYKKIIVACECSLGLYVMTGECKEGTCLPGYKCTGKNYNIKVLRKKRHVSVPPDNNDFENIEALNVIKDFWTSESKTITVACVCKPITN